MKILKLWVSNDPNDHLAREHMDGELLNSEHERKASCRRANGLWETLGRELEMREGCKYNRGPGPKLMCNVLSRLDIVS